MYRRYCTYRMNHARRKAAAFMHEGKVELTRYYMSEYYWWKVRGHHV